MKATGIIGNKFFLVLIDVFRNKMQENFRIINEFSQMKEARKVALSHKMKGKILLGIQKHETKPIDLRKAFLNWYLKGHEEKYSKMVYNIWLNGNISKFTFFMRMKNVIYEGKNKK